MYRKGDVGVICWRRKTTDAVRGHCLVINTAHHLSAVSVTARGCVTLHRPQYECTPCVVHTCKSLQQGLTKQLQLDIFVPLLCLCELQISSLRKGILLV
ncbi:hypothetical protein J6590_036444 [Homalodisca vitripennis]|nr:hypothetical protein J6590_036444 [Homalodisca vitripennis]